VSSRSVGRFMRCTRFDTHSLLAAYSRSR
jgi:hypothetical protein